MSRHTLSYLYSPKLISVVIYAYSSHSACCALRPSHKKESKEMMFWIGLNCENIIYHSFHTMFTDMGSMLYSTHSMKRQHTRHVAFLFQKIKSAFLFQKYWHQIIPESGVLTNRNTAGSWDRPLWRLAKEFWGVLCQCQKI